MKSLNSMQALNDEIAEQKYILKQEFKMFGDDIKVLIEAIPVYKPSGLGKVLTYLNLDGVVKNTAVKLFESYTMAIVKRKDWNPIIGIALNTFVLPIIGGFVKSNAMRLFISAIRSQSK